MIPLIIGAEEKEKLQAMKAYALAHPITLDQIKAMLEATDNPTHRHPMEHYVNLPLSFEVGLTYELQEKAACWHLSMSVKVPGRCAHPAAVEMVLEELGLPSLFQNVGMEMFDEVINIWFLAENSKS